MVGDESWPSRDQWVALDVERFLPIATGDGEVPAKRAEGS